MGFTTFLLLSPYGGTDFYSFLSDAVLQQEWEFLISTFCHNYPSFSGSGILPVAKCIYSKFKFRNWEMNTG